MPQRVLILSNSISGGGAERSSNLISNLLSINGYQVYLQTFKHSQEDFIKLKVEHSCLNLKKRSNVLEILRVIITLRKKISIFKPTHIIVNCELPEFFSVFTRGNHKLIIVEHTTRPWLFMPLLGKFVRLLLKFKKAKWVSDSSNLPIWMGPKIPDMIIPNLVYAERESYKSISHYKHITRLVFIGRFAVQKNPLALCQIAKITDLPVLFVGDGILRGKIDAECSELGIEHEILGFSSNPWEFINEGDVVVVPSLWEGDGLVVLEALQLGLPILLLEIPDLRRLNLPKVNYFRDINECANKIISNYFSVANLRVSAKETEAILKNRSPDHIFGLWDSFLKES